MRVLSIGTDRKVFEEGSAVHARQEAYAKRLGHLDIIVFSPASANFRGVASEKLAIYSTRSWSRLFYGLDAIRIARALPKPDVITVQDPFETGLAGWIIARLWRAPLHVQVHTDFLAPGFARGSLLNRMRRRVARFVLSRAAGIRVVSEALAEKLEARGFSRVAVLPIFTDLSRFEALPRAKHPRFKIALLFIGRLEREKRAELAIDALAAARAAGHDAGLTLVAEGSERSALAQRAQRLGVERFAEFVPWQDDIAPHLSRADCVLVPSAFEGYGLVIVEALAAGVPVVATDVGIAREAGAIIAGGRDFPYAVVEWASGGPRQGALAPSFRASLPGTFEEYVRAYRDDIAACVA